MSREATPRWLPPALAALRGYRRADLVADLVAGTVLTMLTVPQAVAYARLAGLPAEAGLYASLLPMVIYSLFGSARDLVVGPVAVVALLVASTVGNLVAAGLGEPATVLAVVCCEAGAVLLVLDRLRFGGLVNLLGQPVIAGFVNAAVILIVVSQVDEVLGLNVARSDNVVGGIAALLPALPGVHLPTLALAAVCGAIVLVLRYGLGAIGRLTGTALRRDHPASRLGPMVAVVVGAALVEAFDLSVAVLGAVPAGLPLPSLPLGAPALWLEAMPLGTMIGLVGFVESYTIASTLSARRHDRVHPGRELVALGLANIGAGLTGGMPVSGSFARSSVNVAAGSRSIVSVAVCFVLLAVVVQWLTPWLAGLPDAALAVVIIISVAALADFPLIVRQWRFHRHDAWTHGGTIVAILLFGVETGLAFGVVAAVALLVRRTSRPHIAVVGQFGEREHFRNVERHAVTTLPTVLAVRVDESLNFTNSRYVEDFVLDHVAERADGPAPVRDVLVVCSAINDIDSTGLEMIDRLIEELGALGARLHLSEVKGPVMDQLRAADLIARLNGAVFFTTLDAWRVLQQGAPPGASGPAAPDPAAAGGAP